MHTRIILVCLLSFLCCGMADQKMQSNFKEEFFPDLVEALPGILKSQDQKTGRFGKGIWIVTDQNVMYPLAVAWATKREGNPHYHSDEVLNAIMAGGDALIADMDKTGQWE